MHGVSAVEWLANWFHCIYVWMCDVAVHCGDLSEGYCSVLCAVVNSLKENAQTGVRHCDLSN